MRQISGMFWGCGSSSALPTGVLLAQWYGGGVELTRDRPRDGQAPDGTCPSGNRHRDYW
jgi:hypothetical protein